MDSKLLCTALMVILVLECCKATSEAKTRQERSADDLVEVFPLSENMKQQFVDRHNEKRRLEIAKNMRKMIWDDDLARSAEDYARQCNFAHSRSGENIVTGPWTLSQFPEQSVDSLYDEKQYYDIENDVCDTNRVCGHYTQVVWADSERVGCAIAICSAIEGLNLVSDGNLGICHYLPPGNVVGQTPYQIGVRCSNCPDGYACEENLCAKSNGENTTQPGSTTIEYSSAQISTTSGYTTQQSSTVSTFSTTQISSTSLDPTTATSDKTTDGMTTPYLITTSLHTTREKTTYETITDATSNGSTDAETNTTSDPRMVTTSSDPQTTQTMTTATSTVDPGENCTDISKLQEEWVKRFREWKKEIEEWKENLQSYKSSVDGDMEC